MSRGARRVANATIVQLVLFVVIAIACTSYVGVRVLGAKPLGGVYRVSVGLADTGGLTPTSEVTYRGVSVGKVESIRIDPGSAGVTAVLALERGTDIPASSRAVVSQESPIAIQKLDLRPDNANPPFLADGSRIGSEATSRPLPLETLLVHFMRVADSVHTQDLVTLANELSAGLSGTTGDLRRIMHSADALVELMRRNQPTIVNLINGGKSVLDSTGSGGGLPEIAASLRRLTAGVQEQTPAVNTLLDRAPALAEQVLPMLASSAPAVSAMLANAVGATRIVALRTPALNQLLIAAPEFFGRIADTVHHGVGDFYLVGAQGAVCYYDNPRRTVTDTAPRQPNTQFGCRGDQPGLQQRGAANAPRPKEEPVAVTTYDPATNRLTAPDGQQIQLGSDGGQASVLGPRSWYALMLQGAQ
ncbi:MlaD family protein [Amycolatopsis anabasis]|uniref:MlaD family protein n=1 Tax=Amycolatopsis anabasis TaxID=1840409 RepID=UPI00131DC2C0|nr:MlaD family protein [Amycolatopsis anabasis]